MSCTWLPKNIVVCDSPAQSNQGFLSVGRRAFSAATHLDRPSCASVWQAIALWAPQCTCAKMMTASTKCSRSPRGMMMRLGCMIKPDHCVRCVNITQSEVISESTSRRADGPFSERTWLFMSPLSLSSCSHFWQLAEAFCDITHRQSGWSWEGSMHQQCDRSLNIPAGVRPEHSECIVSLDLAQCSSTSSNYLVIMGCAGRRLLFYVSLNLQYVC